MNFWIGWRQVASSLVLLGAMAMIGSSYSVVAVPLAEEFRPSRMVLMLAMTAVSVVTALLAPVLGSLLDRFSLRHLMLLGTLFLSATYASVSLATSFGQVIAIFALLAAPANVLLGMIAVTVLLSRWFVKRRGRAIGIAVAGISIGGIVFPPLMQWLLDGYEWREALRIYAVILLAITVPAAALVVNAPSDRGLHPDGADSHPYVSTARRGNAQVSAAVLLRDPAFWLIALLFAIVIAGQKGVMTNLAPLATDEGIDPSDAAFLISIFSMGGFVAKLSFAAVADFFSLRVLTMLSFAGFTAGMACLTQASAGYSIIALGVALLGLFGGMIIPLKSLLASTIFGSGIVGKAMGMMTTVSLGVSFGAPPIFGLAYDLTGSYTAICLIVCLVAAVAMLGVPYIRMQEKQAPVPAT